MATVREQFLKDIDPGAMLMWLSESISPPPPWYDILPRMFRKGPRCEVIQAIPKMPETGHGVVATPILMIGGKSKRTVYPWDMKVTNMIVDRRAK